MIDPGRLNTRLQLQTPVDDDDGQGGVARAYTTTTTVWAAVIPLGAQQNVSADAAGAALRVRIVLRGNVELTLQHRLVDGIRTYRIVSLRDIDDRRYVEVMAELWVD